MSTRKELLDALTETFKQVGAELTLYDDYYMQIETTLSDGTNVLFDTTIDKKSNDEIGHDIVESLKACSDCFPMCSDEGKTYWDWARIADIFFNGDDQQQRPINPPYSYNGYAVAA